MSSISGLTFSSIANALGSASNNLETGLRSRLERLQNESNVSTATMLEVQQQLQQWTMMTQIQSTVVKELGDTLKGVVQKAA